MAEVRLTGLCRHCGKEFIRPRKERVFCSQACYWQSRAITPERFWENARKTDTCWLWTGRLSDDGYGVVSYKTMRGSPQHAHRVAWILTHGRVENGLWVLHRCDVRHCVRPDHLFLGTPADNSADAAGKGRMTRGEQQKAAKLTEEDVRVIRALRRDQGLTYKELAHRYRVSVPLIGYVVNRLYWKHVD
jgi:hypothetical protein